MAEKTLNLSLNWQGKLQPVGILNIEDTTDGAKMFFAYHSDWIENGFSLGRDLPLTGQVFQNSRHAPLFGFLYDLIPGLTSQKIQKRIQKKDLSNIELLLESQESLRPGALVLSNHFEPLVQAKQMGNVALDLERLILGHLNTKDIDLLYNACDGLPGERFKLSFVSSKNLNAVAKFNTPNPLRNLVQWEAFALLLARRLGLNAIEAQVMNFRGMEALVSHRFDRTAEGFRIPFATAQGLLAATPDSEHTYAEIADILNQEGASPKKDLLELWQRMVFSMAIGNTNDSLSNIGFVRDTWGWRLAPLYGLMPTPTSIGRRHHATAVTPDCDRPSLRKAVDIAPYFGLTKAKAEKEALRIATFVSQTWERTAYECLLDPLEIDNMRKAFEPLEL